MANYTKATDFAAKDGLTSGDPAKIVKGAEIDDEFNAIVTAVNSKANVNSPALTGVPTAPTAVAGTNNTQIATTAFVMNVIYPIGSIYTNAAVSTNPATLFGFGTWEAFGSGKVLVGVDSGDSAFDTLGETGGSKDAVVVAHTHTTSAAGAATGTINSDRTGDFGNFNSGTGVFSVSGYLGNRSQGAAGAGSYENANLSIPDHSHTVNSTGSSGTNANLQPYITVYMWKRTA